MEPNGVSFGTNQTEKYQRTYYIPTIHEHSLYVAARPSKLWIDRNVNTKANTYMMDCSTNGVQTRTEGYNIYCIVIYINIYIHRPFPRERSAYSPRSPI